MEVWIPLRPHLIPPKTDLAVKKIALVATSSLLSFLNTNQVILGERLNRRVHAYIYIYALFLTDGAVSRNNRKQVDPMLVLGRTF